MRSLLTPIGATSHLSLLYDPIFLQEVGDSSNLQPDRLPEELSGSIKCISVQTPGL